LQACPLTDSQETSAAAATAAQSPAPAQQATCQKSSHSCRCCQAPAQFRCLAPLTLLLPSAAPSQARRSETLEWIPTAAIWMPARYPMLLCPARHPRLGRSIWMACRLWLSRLTWSLLLAASCCFCGAGRAVLQCVWCAVVNWRFAIAGSAGVYGRTGISFGPA
jgi:hypothetical protein